MKTWVVGAGIAVAGLALVVGGAAFAASRAEAAATAPALASSFTGGPGLGASLHEYMLQAVAKSLNLAVEDLQSKLASGQTLVQIAEAQRVKAEDLPALLEKARSDALEAAVADGALTQAQADWMAEHPGMLRMLALGQMRGWWDDGARGPRRGFGQRW